MDDLQTGDNDLTGAPPTLDDLGDDDLTGGTPPSDLGDDDSGTPLEKEGLKDALLAERRKRQEYENELYKVRSEIQDLRTKVDKPVATDTDTQLRNMSEEELINLDIASTDIDNPNYEQLKPLRRNIVKALDDKRIEKTVKVLTLEDENKRIQQEKVEADTRALAAYPDIANAGSEIFKTAQQVMAEYVPELRRAGADTNRMPRFLEICVNEAAKRLGIEAKAALKKGQTMEYDRSLAAGKAGFDGGHKKTTAKEPEITERQAQISKMMGVDPKIAAGIKKRLMNDGLVRRTE